MKRKASPIYIAFVCGSLLLSLSSVSAQLRKPASAKSRKSISTKKCKPASPQHPESAPAKTREAPDLQGSYVLIDPEAAGATVNQAIETSVKSMSFLTRGLARDYLKKTNVPYQKIVISYTQEEVSITTDHRAPIRTSVNGTHIDWTREDGEKFEVSTVWEGEKLRQTFQGKNGRRVNAYSIATGSKTLTMQVKITSTRLRQPLEYQLSYQRN